MRYQDIYQLALRVVAGIEESLSLPTPRKRQLAEQVLRSLAADEGHHLAPETLTHLLDDAAREYHRRLGWRLHKGLRWLQAGRRPLPSNPVR